MKPRAKRTSSRTETTMPDIGVLRAQHMALAERTLTTDHGPQPVIIDESESPLAWLAKRRGRDGRPLVSPHQLQAGERLRTDFTRAHMMPRTTSNWSGSVSSGRGGGGVATITGAMITARQRVNQALDTVGPEFSGLLLDLCCFLKGLEDIERERGWPARSAKVVLLLGLDRLARHYGYRAQAKGPHDATVRTWLAEGAGFKVEPFG